AQSYHCQTLNILVPALPVPNGFYRPGFVLDCAILLYLSFVISDINNSLFFDVTHGSLNLSRDR
ncbi:MAG: hypothetical protein AAF063_36700, partial [Cyanobacteria bacterium J06643_5]